MTRPGDPPGWVWACDQRRRRCRDRVIGWASAVSAARTLGHAAVRMGNEEEIAEATRLLAKAEDGLDDALTNLAAAAGYELVRRPVGGPPQHGTAARHAEGCGCGACQRAASPPDGLGGPLEDVDVHQALGLPRQ